MSTCPGVSRPRVVLPPTTALYISSRSGRRLTGLCMERYTDQPSAGRLVRLRRGSMSPATFTHSSRMRGRRASGVDRFVDRVMSHIATRRASVGDPSLPGLMARPHLVRSALILVPAPRPSRSCHAWGRWPPLAVRPMFQARLRLPFVCDGLAAARGLWWLSTGQRSVAVGPRPLPRVAAGPVGSSVSCLFCGGASGIWNRRWPGGREGDRSFER